MRKGNQIVVYVNREIRGYSAARLCENVTVIR